MKVVRWIVPPPGRLTIIAAVMLAALLAYPVRNEITRVGIVVCLVAVDVGAVMLLARGYWWLWALILPQVVVLVLLLMPGRTPNAWQLDEAYLRALRRFEGTRYVWGGENHLGVDCSGLLRSAMVEAHALESVRTFNPALLRQAIWLWWHDASANEMGKGYSGLTKTIGPAMTLAEASVRAAPGDFAVTADSVHVLAYLGDKEWIEADPFVKRVIRIKAGDHSPWWDAKVVPGRWTELAPGDPD